MNWMKSARADCIPEASCGDWRVKRFAVTKEDVACQFNSAFRVGRFVPPGTYTGLYRGQTIVMSDTPDELRDCYPILGLARGRVLVNGLGLGCVVRALLADPKVTSIDVVELSRDVIELIAPHISDPRLKVHCGDAYSFKFPADARWDCAWHDIWDTLCTDDLAEHGKIRRKYARRVSVWQGCWGEEFLRREQRRERRFAF